MSASQNPDGSVTLTGTSQPVPKVSATPPPVQPPALVVSPAPLTTVQLSSAEAVAVATAIGYVPGAVTPPVEPPPVIVPPAGVILLDDFTTTRLNHDSPAGPLFNWYGNPSAPGYSKQTSQIGNGLWTVTTQGLPYAQFIPYPYVDPNGFMHENLMQGPWNPNSNRMYLWLKAPKNIPRVDAKSAMAEIGVYVKAPDGQPSNQGDHYYHYLTNNFVAGKWMRIVLNRVPQHRVGSTGFTDPNPTFPDNPTMVNGMHGGNPVNYFDGLTRFYFCDEHGAGDWSGAWVFQPITYATVPNQPETFVSTVTLLYDGSEYQFSWQGGRNVVWQYDVYVSAVSMIANGLAAGTKVASTASRGDTYTGVFAQSAAMPQMPVGTYVAIVPKGQATFFEDYLPTI